jgi:predicted PurR-regulated permease PerM
MASMPGGATRIEIPRWIQLVGLPLLLILAWTVAGAVRHVVFVFLVAALIALLLNPLVKGLGRARIPRGFAVALVYLSFATALVVAIAALGVVVVDQTRSAADRVETYLTVERGRLGETNAERDLGRLQDWLDTHGLESVEVEEQGREFLDDFGAKDIRKYTDEVIDFVEGAAVSTFKFLFSLVLVIVVSIYMLLDMSRLARVLDRRFPSTPGSAPLLVRMERSLAGYVKGQLLLSLIIGTSAGLGLWLLGVLGWLPNGQKYALLFGTWVAVTELIPYLGPWLGAIPPFIYALVAEPLSALWVALLFLGIHQIEGHIVVPNVMGSALRLHPLLVIFGLLAGGEIYGLPGALIALPLLATGRAAWEFFSERVVFEPWREGGVVPVEVTAEPPEEAVTLEEQPPRRPFAPVPRPEPPASEPPAAAQR